MSEKLTAEQVRAAIFNASVYASFDGAKYYADGIGMQAIADELNATLGNDGVGRTNDGVAERDNEPSMAMHWNGDVLILTIPRDPSSIHVQRSDGQPRKVYASELELTQTCSNRLEGENDKLRELARSAWRCIRSGSSCSECRLVAGGCTLQSAMREFGIEVDE